MIGRRAGTSRRRDTPSTRAGHSTRRPTYKGRERERRAGTRGGGRVADERERAAALARLKAEEERQRRLVAEQNRVTFVPHAPTLVDNGDAEALGAQQKAAVEASRGALPPDFLELLPLP